MDGEPDQHSYYPKTWWLLIAATLVGLVIAEAVLQTVRREPPTPFEYHPRMGWTVKRHYVGRQRVAGVETTVRTNGQRMRESREFPAETDAYRIAVVGDSFVWGYGVEEEERFTEILEAELGPSFEVLNFGVAGFGSGQHLLRIEEDVLALRPDMLVVAFFLNDIEELRRDLSQTLPKPRFVDRGGRLELRGVPVQRVDGWDRPPRELKLPRLLRSLAEGTGVSHGYFAPHVDLFRRHRSGWLEESLRLNDLIYAEMARLARTHGMAFVVLELPFKEYFLPDDLLQSEFGVTRELLGFDRVSRRLRELGDRLGFLHVAPYARFEEDGGAANFLEGDPHYNARGHRAVAEALAEGLLSSELMPDRSAAPGSRAPRAPHANSTTPSLADACDRCSTGSRDV